MSKLDLNWNTIIRYGLILFIISVVCTLLLAVTNMVTEPVIAQQNEIKNIEAQQSVLPDADNFVAADDLEKIKKDIPENADIVESLDYAYSGDELVGYSVKTTPNGYGGEIELLTGIDTEGTITGIYILDQSETAGLGARSTEESFQEQYEGLTSTEEVEVEKSGPIEGNEIQAISGATITSKAVTLGVNTSSEAVKAAQEVEGK